MSDYMFMLESHVTISQHRALAAVQKAAADAHVSLFLTGGAVRDMFGGFPIRDLDFTVEGDGLALGRVVAQESQAKLLVADERRKRAELVFPGDVTVEIAMARTEAYEKPGAKPQVTPSGIHEDLRCRDFTVNALALSLNRASRGLVLDPVNGCSDLERRELRAVSNTGFYDDPVRLLRLIRYRVRLGFTVAERTQRQYANAYEAGMAMKISKTARTDELRHIAYEANPGEVLRQLEQERLLALFSPVLSGDKLNLAGFAKLMKARHGIPFGVDLHVDEFPLFLSVLGESLTAKERGLLAEHLALTEEEHEHWQKLPARGKKLEKVLTDPSLQRPSRLYEAVQAAAGEQVLYLLIHSSHRLLHDRLRNYFHKYWAVAQELTDDEVKATGLTMGSPAFEKKRKELIAARLNSRPKKTPAAEETPIAATAGRGR